MIGKINKEYKSTQLKNTKCPKEYMEVPREKTKKKDLIGYRINQKTSRGRKVYEGI